MKPPAPALAAGALLAAAVLLAYANVYAAPFQFDDYRVIVSEARVHTLLAWWSDVGHGIRPVLKLSYALNWQVGHSARGFHVVNVAIHLVNTALVCWLAQRACAAWGEPAASVASTGAVIAALAFALHPAATEAVTYVCGRSSSLMTTFYLAGLIAALRSQSARWARDDVIAGVCFALALGTKESAVSLPLVLLVLECSRPGPVQARNLCRRLVAPLVVLGLALAMFSVHPLYRHRLVPTLDGTTLARDLRTEVSAVSYLLGRFTGIYPANIDPDLRWSNAWTMPLALQATALAIILISGLYALRRRPWLGCGILWFVAVLAPTNSVLPRPDLANDRQLYLATVGLWIALGVELELLRARIGWLRSPLRAVTACALVALALLTSLRNRDYASETRLWEQTVAVSPEKARPYNNLGYAYELAGRLPEARAAYDSALRLDPRFAKAIMNRGALERDTSKAAAEQRIAARPALVMPGDGRGALR